MNKQCLILKDKKIDKKLHNQRGLEEAIIVVAMEREKLGKVKILNLTNLNLNSTLIQRKRMNMMMRATVHQMIMVMKWIVKVRMMMKLWIKIYKIK